MNVPEHLLSKVKAESKRFSKSQLGLLKSNLLFEIPVAFTCFFTEIN